MISKVLQLELLQSAIEAAQAGSLDAGTSDYSTKEKFQLNEQWCQSYVGLTLNNKLRTKFENDGNFVTFETSMGWLNEICNEVSIRGRLPDAYSNRSRYDLVVWDEMNRASGVIEIKDTAVLSESSVERDCLKIKVAIDKFSKLRWGIFLFSVRASSKREGAKVNEQLEKKSQKIVDYVSQKFAENYKKHECGDIEQFDSCRVMWTGILFSV